MKTVVLDAVTKSYDGARVLTGITFEVDEGERLVVLGPSGCGKTTILRLIAGFIAPDAGTVSIAGEPVSGDGRIVVPPERRNVGMVFQDLALWPHLSVKGNVEFGLKVKGIPKIERERRVREALELVGLAGYAERKPAELSGGQQQRVALVRALVLEPRVLLMDEPLSSLDQELNERLRKEVLGLQERIGFTLIYVTHDRGEAIDIATRLLTLEQGRVVGEGTVEELRAHFESRRLPDTCSGSRGEGANRLGNRVREQERREDDTSRGLPRVSRARGSETRMLTDRSGESPGTG